MLMLFLTRSHKQLLHSFFLSQIVSGLGINYSYEFAAVSVLSREHTWDILLSLSCLTNNTHWYLKVTSAYNKASI